MIQLRMTQAVHQEMRSDLDRSHLFAAERVGYVFIRPAGEAVLVATGYAPIPDEFYIKDNSVGARVDHRGIALAMKRADINNEGILLVHDHGRTGFPRFSRDDLADHPEFLRSFRNANSKTTHGFLLLSNNKMIARVWTPGKASYKDISRYTIIGLPLAYNWMGWY
jgi:hypothetical protein